MSDDTRSKYRKPVHHTKSMERLQEAAQRLREAVQAMAQQPAGERRNNAMVAVNEALYDTEQAMISLPPDLRVRADGDLRVRSDRN